MNKDKLLRLINDFFKRTFDILVSFVAIVILFPFFIVVSILIKVDSKGPVIFRQVRVGKNEKNFEILKFRTMVTDAEKIGKQITIGEDKRITKIGRFLRKYKLDEFPQLFNVLKGDMSFVGPRPEVPRYTSLYTDEQKEVFKVRPGITDYASIKYRNENEILGESENPEETYINKIMNDKLKINLEYLKRKSIIEDIKIIFKTLVKIIK